MVDTMKVTVTPTRQNGVMRERKTLKEAASYSGDLVIVDEQEPELKRVVKVARLAGDFGTHELFEAHVVWMSDDRMCLSGFERVNRSGRTIDYAQSWLCQVANQQFRRRR